MPDDTTTTPATEPRELTPLRWLFDAYTQTQKLRIMIGNRLDAVNRGTDTAPVPSSLSRHYQQLLQAEDDIITDAQAFLKDHLAMKWLGGVRGVGPTLATKVLGLIGDIGRFETPSKLWRFSGYGLGRDEQGNPVRDRPVKGEKLCYNVKLKTALYVLGTSFLKTGSRYCQVYDEARAYYEQRELMKPKEEQWTLAHQHLASMRKMMKMFLAHLWETWRLAEGLPIRPPYVGEKLGHTSLLRPVGHGRGA